MTDIIIGLVIVGIWLLNIWYHKFPTKTSKDILKARRKEAAKRNTRRQEWEWKRAV